MQDYTTESDKDKEDKDYKDGDDVALSNKKHKGNSQLKKPRKKRMKLTDTLLEDKFLEEIEKYLKKEIDLISVKEKMAEEQANIPDIVGCTNQTALKRMLFALRISFTTFECPIFNASQGVDLLLAYAKQPSLLENLERIIKYYKLNNDTKSCILRALDPLKVNIYNDATELQYKTTHFSPLFEIVALSPNKLFVNSNKQIPELLNKNILTNNLKESLTEFQVDGVLVQQFNDKFLLKIIREDNRDRFENHFDHPDFFRVIFIMRLALSRNVRELVKQDLEMKIHNKLFVLGMTTDAVKTNLYCMQAQIDNAKTITYQFFCLGSFLHDEAKDRAILLDYILQSLSIPDPDVVENYLKRSRPSQKEPTTSSKQLQTEIGIHGSSGNTFCYEEKATNVISSTTTALWKGQIKNESGKTWNVYCKQISQESSDPFISVVKFLTLCVGTTHNNEILTLAGEQVFNLDNEEETMQFITDLLVQLTLLGGGSHIIHNDIKPSNVIKYDGHYFLIDYGFAKKFKRFDGTTCYDSNDVQIKSRSGTPPYDSPEKKKFGFVSPKSDVYSLGYSLAELTRNCTSENVQKLVAWMTLVDVEKRPTPMECLNHIYESHKMLVSNSNSYFTKKDYFTSTIEQVPTFSLYSWLTDNVECVEKYV